MNIPKLLKYCKCVDVSIGNIRQMHKDRNICHSNNPSDRDMSVNNACYRAMSHNIIHLNKRNSLLPQ